MPRGVPKGKKKQTDEERKATKSAKAKKYYSSEQGKVTVKKYQQSEKGKVNRKKYLASEERKATVKKYEQSEKGKATGKRNSFLAEKRNQAIQLKVLRYYSKLHSNSEIPCCRCCGLNDHTDFLALDHIQGRYEMDSIPELVKIEYKSALFARDLFKWIKDNNYLSDLKTEYFQILCHNCNFAKGYLKNNNECPMKGKPH